MNNNESSEAPSRATYYVDEAGDGVLFGPKGRDRLSDENAPQFFILGMVRCNNDWDAAARLEKLRHELIDHPLYSSIWSLRPEEKKTARAFHAKDDHSDIRIRVFELLLTLEFKFYPVIKDMRAVQHYVKGRNRMSADYRYHPNELYDLTVRMLFKQRLHKETHYRVTFARRGQSDRTLALRKQLDQTRQRFLKDHNLRHDPTLEIQPAYSWETPCLQIADYCLWALQRYYERQDVRFLKSLWPKVSIIHDVDDPHGKNYGSYFRRRDPLPDVGKIKNRWIYVSLVKRPETHGVEPSFVHRMPEH